MKRRPPHDPLSGRDRVSRRLYLNGMIACAVAAPILGLSGRVPARAADKISKKLVSYQDQPKGKAEMCATCKFFLPPASCALVEGTISPQGWCQRYVKRS